MHTHPYTLIQRRQERPGVPRQRHKGAVSDNAYLAQYQGTPFRSGIRPASSPLLDVSHTRSPLVAVPAYLSRPGGRQRQHRQSAPFTDSLQVLGGKRVPHNSTALPFLVCRHAELSEGQEYILFPCPQSVHATKRVQNAHSTPSSQQARAETDCHRREPHDSRQFSTDCMRSAHVQPAGPLARASQRSWSWLQGQEGCISSRAHRLPTRGALIFLVQGEHTTYGKPVSAGNACADASGDIKRLRPMLTIQERGR
jgi:hypothetical protein